jgi:4-amino-4-deoxy-L-arabinose transferase-like glycosyltransferase
VVAARHPSVLGLWFLHVSDRIAANPEHFTGKQPWWHYGPALLVQVLPWTPLALWGAWRSLPRALHGGRGGGERLLWAWAVAPLVLLSLATVKTAHYAIHVLPPWSVWAALGLVRLGERLQRNRGWSPTHVRRAAWGTFVTLGTAYALGFAVLGPITDRRGVEWAFYERAASQLRPGEPVALLYNVPDWDRAPYKTPFGLVPHDWAVRLFYLNRRDPAPCRFGIAELANTPLAPSSPTFAVIGRASDLPGLRQLGQVETLAQGPPVRFDRTYQLYRITPDTPPPVAARAGNGRRQ